LWKYNASHAVRLPIPGGIGLLEPSLFVDGNTGVGKWTVTRTILRCDRCDWKVVLALTDIARTHGAALPVWRTIDRLCCHRRLNGTVVRAECDTYEKTTGITREVVVRER
jgi:hypothetical protein